jgi:bis(5'-nucleosyl)-tetraphosphatase (symmetrical)
LANYIVGDIQGCYEELKLLLKQADFNKNSDTIWFAGDLVARGPDSLKTLRYVKKLGSAAKVILGNHDLHLLAVYHGISPLKKKDKTAPIINAKDCDELMAWLREQPLMIEHDDFVMCHAGISPEWDLETARREAKIVENVLQSDRWEWLLENMYDNQPDAWDENLQGIERYRYTINAFTRMRFVFPDGRLDMACKLPPSEVEDGSLIPWLDLPDRKPLGKAVLFGHWAALEGVQREDLIGLDTGCVWGGELTMIRWEDKQLFTQSALSAD